MRRYKRIMDAYWITATVLATAIVIEPSWQSGSACADKRKHRDGAIRAYTSHAGEATVQMEAAE